MRILHTGLLFLSVVSAATTQACDKVPAGEPLWIRLTAPISTYTAKPGDAVPAVLTQDLVCDNEIVLPMGALIDGVVRSRHKVGWGIRHETAALEIEFHRATPHAGVEVPLTARVEEVENARESVHNGIIHGIRSSDTFQGSVNSRLIHLPTWNPYSDTVLLAYKAVFPIFPEPEIYYPAGTDIRLRTTTEIAPPPEGLNTVHEATATDKTDSDRLDHLVEQLPVRAMTTKHIDADLINIVFLGSEQQVQSAFRQAGWNSADSHSKRTWMKNFYALLDNCGYPQQPMMTFYLNGRPEDMNWQKNLNSYGRRDHLRIWKVAADGSTGSVWATSSTHDTGAVLSIKYEGFVHHIAPDIDDERSTVIRDLNFAGCVSSVSYVSRRDMPIGTHNATGDLMYTDGAVAVVTLQDCRSDDLESASRPNANAFRPGNHVFRYIRKEILTVRSDMLRANIIYGAYEVSRMSWTAMRRPALPKSCEGYALQGCDIRFQGGVVTADHQTIHIGG